jgi:hypothetical protein
MMGSDPVQNTCIREFLFLCLCFCMYVEVLRRADPPSRESCQLSVMAIVLGLMKSSTVVLTCLF